MSMLMILFFIIKRKKDSLDLRIAILTLPTDGSKPISIKLERNDIQDLIIKQAHQLVERFEEQMIIVQTQVMQNYRCHSTTKDIGNDQSKDKLKQKMTWKSSAFDPTLGTTTSSSAGFKNMHQRIKNYYMLVWKICTSYTPTG
ncbi:12607_t:CDS:2 [Entrophospora sp. SA101]|nr:12607_t:CDS:2 [Entrophospora sp. SA101]